MARAKTAKAIYQLKINLKRAKPPIWRRFLVDADIGLPELHQVIQTVMGWMDCHLHQFIQAGEFYALPDPYDDDYRRTLDERKFRLRQLLRAEKDHLDYLYDFGDGWDHRIVLEKILPFEAGTTLPCCLKAKGACPPEDVGGLFGYAEFLEAMADPDHPEHDEYQEWFGGDFDPAWVDVKAINFRLIPLTG